MTIYLSTVRTLFMYVNIIFFTIYIWYCGYCKVFLREQIDDQRNSCKWIHEKIKGVEEKKWLCSAWLNIAVYVVALYYNDLQMRTTTWFFFSGILFAYCETESFKEFSNELKMTIHTTVMVSIIMFCSANDIVTYISNQTGILFLMGLRYIFIKIYQRMKIEYMEYTDLIIALVWTGFLLIFIQKFFFNPELYLLVATCIIFMLKDHIIRTFSKYTAYKATSFMLIEALILTIGIYGGYHLLSIGINPYFWIAVCIIAEYSLFLWETYYFICIIKNQKLNKTTIG